MRLMPERMRAAVDLGLQPDVPRLEAGVPRLQDLGQHARDTRQHGEVLLGHGIGHDPDRALPRGPPRTRRFTAET